MAFFRLGIFIKMILIQKNDVDSKISKKFSQPPTPIKLDGRILRFLILSPLVTHCHLLLRPPPPLRRLKSTKNVFFHTCSHMMIFCGLHHKIAMCYDTWSRKKGDEKFILSQKSFNVVCNEICCLKMNNDEKIVGVVKEVEGASKECILIMPPPIMFPSRYTPSRLVTPPSHNAPSLSTLFLYKQPVYKQPVLRPLKNVATFEAQISPVAKKLYWLYFFHCFLVKFAFLRLLVKKVHTLGAVLVLGWSWQKVWTLYTL